MTWYISTGTESVPGLPVGLPVTVERRETERPEPGAEQPAWQELPGRFEALAEFPPQPVSSSAQRIAASAGTAPFHAVRVIPASVYIPAAVLDGGITRMVHSGGVELAVVEGGDTRRPTLIFIHGYPDTKEQWDEVLMRLGQRYHLVAYDVRGAGRSSRPRGAAAYDLARLADDLDAVIAAVSPRRPVHLVGHDWGAIQGWEFVSLERFRNKLASFTAIAGPPLDLAVAGSAEPVRPRAHSGWGDSPATRASQPFGRSAWGLAGLPWRLRRSWYIVALCTPGVPTLTWRWLLTAPRWAWFLRNVERVGEKASEPAATLAADGIHGSKLYRRNLPRRTLRPRASAVAQVPVQLVIPTRDHFISPSYYHGADRLAPALRRRVVEATHWVPRTEPGLIARWIDEFVDQVETGEAPRAPSWSSHAGPA